MDEVDVSKRLRVYITTDHGRLLSESKRSQTVPHGMMPHGRAAWGLPGSYAFDSDGIFVDGAIAYLDPARFGIPDTAAVVLTEDAFRTADGKSGVESFTHGGVFPEEVLIPWLEFTRDRGPLEVSLKITGNGIAGATGRIQLEVKNTSQVRIEIVDVRLPFATAPLSCSLSARPLTRVVGDWTVNNWPQKSEVAGLLATVVFELPTGERESHGIVPELTVDEMYSRDTILDDLAVKETNGPSNDQLRRNDGTKSCQSVWPPRYRQEKTWAEPTATAWRSSLRRGMGVGFYRSGNRKPKPARS